MDYSLFIKKSYEISDEMNDTNGNIIACKFRRKLNSIKICDGFESAYIKERKDLEYVYCVLKMCYLYSCGMHPQDAYNNSVAGVDSSFTRLIISGSLKHTRIKRKDLTEEELDLLRTLVNTCGQFLLKPSL